MRWFLLRFANLLRVCSLQIISRDHSNTFLLINLQKTKIYPKDNIAARAICSDIVMSLQTGFSPLRNAYFNDMQINSYIDQVLFRELSVAATCSEKFRDSSEQSWGKRIEKTGKCKAFWFSSKRN